MAAVHTFPPRQEADDCVRLESEVDALRAQVAALTRQRDHYAERLKQHLLAFVPEPPTEEEFARVEANPTDLTGLIAQLERN